jgi:hypothetical protein
VRPAFLLLAAVLISTFGIGTASAQTVTAPDAMARYRVLTSVAPKPCSKSVDTNDIVVCANKLRESQKVPYIEELRVGDRPRLAYGEVPRAAASADASAPCPIRGCPRGGSVLGAIGKLIDRVRD